MVKRLFFAVLLIAVNAFSYAQEIKEVTLVVNGEGVTKEDAINVALRSAIEQAFGVFVSANTSILNDELVRDEIATVSSGNIQKYTELGTSTLPNGQYSTTLQATVSINKLVKYAQSKGSECEFAGATFGANIKMLQLRYDNAQKALFHLREYTKMIGSHVFDYEIKVGEPKTSNGKAIIPVTIKYLPNDITKEYFNTIMSTLDLTSFTHDEMNTLRGVDYSKYVFYSISSLISRNSAYEFLCNRFKEHNSLMKGLVEGAIHGGSRPVYDKCFPMDIVFALEYSRPTKEWPCLMGDFDKYVINGFVIKDNNGTIIIVPELNGFRVVDPPVDMRYIFIDNLVAYENRFKASKGGSIKFEMEIPIDYISKVSNFIVEPKQYME